MHRYQISSKFYRLKLCIKIQLDVNVWLKVHHGIKSILSSCDFSCASNATGLECFILDVWSQINSKFYKPHMCFNHKGSKLSSSICLVHMNVFAKFDEILSMVFQDIKERKPNGRKDGQRENSIPTHKHNIKT